MALDQLIQRYEPELLVDNDIMPNDFKTKLQSGIVVFKIVFDDIQAKEKLGQHRLRCDIATMMERKRWRRIWSNVS